MSAPLWQFWTDWVVEALGALATVLAVLAALFREQLRHRFAPPRLSIDLSSAEGYPAILYSYDPRTPPPTTKVVGFMFA